MVEQNLIKLRSSIPATVTLVAVSKTKPDELILQAYDAGHRDFGENYVQEMTDKYTRLPKDIRWHFIGHLQSNKVKYIVPFVYLIHGIDSFKLLKEVNKQSAKLDKVTSCLLQVFIASEETKFGLSFEECRQVLADSKELKNVSIKGLMGMASNTEDHQQVQREFASLSSFRKEMWAHYPDLEILSMGMSGDYQMAISEGSNHVRVGSLIFGERDYSK